MLKLRRLVRLAQYEMGRQQVALVMTLPGVLAHVLHLLCHSPSPGSASARTSH